MNKNKFFILMILISHNLSFIFAHSPQEETEQISNVSQAVNEVQNEEDEKDFGNLELLDQIESEISFLNGETTETKIVTMADIKRRGFDGKKWTVKEVEDLALASQLAELLKATMSNDDINRTLKKNGLDEKQILNIVDAWGFIDKEEFFKYLREMFLGQTAINYKIESELISTSEEIESYYNSNIAQYQEEAQYTVETAFVPFTNEQEKENLKTKLENYCQGKIANPYFVNWQEPIQLNENEITANNSFLNDLPVNGLYIKEYEDGFSLYKMKEKKLRTSLPLNEVKEDIVLRLRAKKFETACKNANENLRNQALIVRPAEIYPIPISTDEFEK